MKNIAIDYFITIEGADLDAKCAKKLKAGDFLSASRIYDEEDTYEILITDRDKKELGLLDYKESLGIAPFLDEEGLKILSCIVKNVTFTQGKSRAGDLTKVEFSINFEYDEDSLLPNTFGDGTFAFLPFENRVLAMSLYCALDYDMPVISQTHLNRYVIDIDLNEDSKEMFEVNFDEDENYFFFIQLLLNESFSKCRLTCKLYSDKDSFDITLTDEEKQTVLELVNHRRIFSDEKTLSCEIED